MSLFRSALIALSEARGPRKFAEKSRLARRISQRFVAGTELSQALAVVRELNALGISATMDALGENVATEAEAARAAQMYHTMLERIDTLKLNAYVSVKLTQMGMDLGEKVAEAMVNDLAHHAARCGNFVRVDMEGSRYTQGTLDIVRRLHATPSLSGSIGVVVQAYLRRTGQDVDRLLSQGIRLRLCKGAYLEPAEIAFQSKADTDRNYVKLARKMLKSGIFHGLATHDESIIDQMKAFSRSERIDPQSFEFQMLYGIRRDLQQSLVKQGYRVRVYVPFGSEWYPYFVRRLAERPANLLFIAKNLFR